MPSSLESDLASSEDGVSTLKSLELSIVPVVNQVSTAVAEVAAAFSAEDGVSTLKSLELSIVPVVNQVSTAVAKGRVLLNRLGLNQCLLVGKPVVSHLHHAENESNHTS